MIYSSAVSAQRSLILLLPDDIGHWRVPPRGATRWRCKFCVRAASINEFCGLFSLPQSPSYHALLETVASGLHRQSREGQGGRVRERGGAGISGLSVTLVRLPCAALWFCLALIHSSLLSFSLCLLLILPSPSCLSISLAARLVRVAMLHRILNPFCCHVTLLLLLLQHQLVSLLLFFALIRSPLHSMWRVHNLT